VHQEPAAVLFMPHALARLGEAAWSASSSNHSATLRPVLPLQVQPSNGGALLGSMGSSNAINATNTTFASNTANSGGAVFITGPSEGSGYGSFNCLGCVFTSNEALQSGGAVMANGNMQLKLSSSTVTRNAASAGDGGAILCLGCQLLVINMSSLTDNTAVWGQGGGCSCLDCKHVVVDGLTAKHNTAAAGGALSLSLTSTRSSIQAHQKARHLLADEPDGITNSNFEANAAVIGSCSGSKTTTCHGESLPTSGGAGAANGDVLLGPGGAVQLQTAGPFSIKSSSFTRNSAASDGGEARSGQHCAWKCKLHNVYVS
jgi:predicted outer membrane repeat protein